MKKFIFIFIFFLIPSLVFPKSIYKVGVLLYSNSFSKAFSGFKYGMSKLGFAEHKNIVYYVENINGNINRIDNILKKFSKENIDLILTTTTFVILKVKELINQYKIPVIFTIVGAPLKGHVVNSFKTPGGYITGISHMAYSLVGKRLEIFKDAFPFLKSVIFFYNPDKKYLKNQLALIKPVAKKLNIELIPLFSRSRDEMIKEISKLKIKDNTGIFMFPDAIAMANVDLMIKLSYQKKLPLMVLDNIMIKKGCIGYSPSFFNVGIQASFIAQKIFNGVLPGNIPVQFPSEIKLEVNLKLIKQLGLYNCFNKNYLYYANRVIK